MFKKIIIAMLGGCTAFTHAQTLDQAIKTQAKIGEQHLNLIPERQYDYEEDSEWDLVYKYKLFDKKVVATDLNGDGRNDAVVLTSYCESTSCHLTTTSLELMVFLGQGNNQYKHIVTKSLPGVHANLKVYPSRLIEVKCFTYNDSDPACCPSDEIIKKYRLANNNLYTVN